jgi:hypothetical protein
MSKKLQKDFKKSMRKISRSEAKNKTKFYSFLERKMIKGYYAKQNSNSKRIGMGIKLVQIIMFPILVVLGAGFVGSLVTLDWTIASLCLMLLSTTLLIVGLIHPHTIWSERRYVTRTRVLKIYGTISVICLVAFLLGILADA